MPKTIRKQSCFRKSKNLLTYSKRILFISISATIHNSLTSIALHCSAMDPSNALDAQTSLMLPFKLHVLRELNSATRVLYRDTNI